MEGEINNSLQTYEYQSQKGDTYIAKPLANLKDIPGFPAEFLDMHLQVRKGQIVHIKSKPLSDEEKARRKAERDAEYEKLRSAKAKVVDEYKLAVAEYNDDQAVAKKEIRAVKEPILEKLKVATSKYFAIKGIRTMDKLKEVLSKY